MIKNIKFVNSKNELLVDEVALLRDVGNQQKAFLRRTMDEQLSNYLIIKEKSAEMRILNKEKEDTLKNLLDCKV